MDNTEILPETIVLKEGLEISSKISVLSWDRISILQRKFQSYEFWEITFVCEVIKVLLIDKTKIKELDDMLNWEITEEFLTEINSWGEKMNIIIDNFMKLKKK